MMFIKMDGEYFTVDCERCNMHWSLRLPQSADNVITFLYAALHHQCKPLSARDVLRSEA